MKRLYFNFAIIAFIFIISIYISSYSQEERQIELTAQGILARVDRIMEYPSGLIKGSLKHIKPDGTSYSIDFTGSITKEDFLFKFSSKNRGEELKILYNLGGEDIWVYTVHSLKLYHKLGIDKYDPILFTNFNFIDLSNADLQSNYTATIVGESQVKGYDSYRLILKPIFKGGEYGILSLYVTKKDFIPLRIDYHDRDKAIFKIMTIVKTKEKGDRIIPIRYDMMDIKSGTLTIMSLFSFDSSIKFNKEIFRSEKLGE